MEIKYTIGGLLVYMAMAAYLAAFAAMVLLRRRRGSEILYFAGFALALAGFIYRWQQVGHVPMQNLFEVFTCLGLVIYPISLFCHRVLKVGGRGADMLIGAVVLFPAGFVFSAEPQHLPPALQSRLFAPHVVVYMLSYMLMAKAAYHAFVQIVGKGVATEEGMPDAEEASYMMVRAGFPLLVLGLVLGSVWGKLSWGDYWGWDPKELWSLATMLVYVGYFHFRYMFGRRYRRINSVWAIAGMACIMITLLWVNLSKIFMGLHSYAT